MDLNEWARSTSLLFGCADSDAIDFWHYLTGADIDFTMMRDVAEQLSRLASAHGPDVVTKFVGTLRAER
jgi:hypothetical protein